MVSKVDLQLWYYLVMFTSLLLTTNEIASINFFSDLKDLLKIFPEFQTKGYFNLFQTIHLCMVCCINFFDDVIEGCSII